MPRSAGALTATAGHLCTSCFSNKKEDPFRTYLPRAATDSSDIGCLQVLYGDKKRLDIDRLQKLISAFGNFTTSAANHEGDATSASAASGTFDFVLNERVKGRPSHGYNANKPMLNDATKEALKVIFSKDVSMHDSSLYGCVTGVLTICGAPQSIAHRCH